jgi:hypothetical protein
MIKKFFLLACLIAFLFSNYGCRDEIVPTSNGTGSNDSLLFSKDSIYVGPLGINGETTYRIMDTSITKIKVSYSLETDDVTDTATTSSFSVIADSTFNILIHGHNNNGDFNYTCNIKSKNTGYADVFFRVNSYIVTNFYIVMRNIRLYRTN